MTALNFPPVDLKIKIIDKKNYVFDVVRKKYIVLSPEEEVRQNLIHYLHYHLQYPFSLMAVEKALYVNNLLKRSDLVVYNKKGAAVLLAECKAPNIKLSQAVFEQAATYNIHLKVPYLLVTNGLQHFCCAINFQTASSSYLSAIPSFSDLAS